MTTPRLVGVRVRDPDCDILALSRLGDSAWPREPPSLSVQRSAESQRPVCHPWCQASCSFLISLVLGVGPRPLPYPPTPPPDAHWKAMTGGFPLGGLSVCWFYMEGLSDTCVPFWSHGRPASGPGSFVSLPRCNTALYHPPPPSPPTYPSPPYLVVLF